MRATDFEAAYGFRRDEVRLDNWRLAPWNIWSFHNVNELIPTALVSAAPGLAEEAEADATPLINQSLVVGCRRSTVADILRRTSTDALVVMKAGRFVADFHAPHSHPRSRHLLFSITKSLTGMLAGLAEGAGLLDPEAPVTDYVPEVASSAYGDATVRHLLDMRISVAFDETYQDLQGTFARYRRAMLWNRRDAEKAETMLSFLASLPKEKDSHGGPFRYRSPNAALLAIVVERATGKRFADLMASQIWQPIGARQDACITVDASGAAHGAGGACLAARDLARLGELMRRGGTVDGRRVLPAEWVRDTLYGGSAQVWKDGDFADLLPEGRYRNQWYQSGYASGAFLGIGIHGQWLYVNPHAETVIVKFSSQPEPVDVEFDSVCLQLFEAISEMV